MIAFKTLEWNGYGDRIEAAAFGIKVFYWVRGEPSNWSLWTLGETSYLETPGYETQFSAKAAAQVDFNRRVLASIEGGV